MQQTYVVRPGSSAHNVAMQHLQQVPSLLSGRLSVVGRPARKVDRVDPVTKADRVQSAPSNGRRSIPFFFSHVDLHPDSPSQPQGSLANLPADHRSVSHFFALRLNRSPPVLDALARWDAFLTHALPHSECMGPRDFTLIRTAIAAAMNGAPLLSRRVAITTSDGVNEFLNQSSAFLRDSVADWQTSFGLDCPSVTREDFLLKFLLPFVVRHALRRDESSVVQILDGLVQALTLGKTDPNRPIVPFQSKHVVGDALSVKDALPFVPIEDGSLHPSDAVDLMRQQPEGLGDQCAEANVTSNASLLELVKLLDTDDVDFAGHSKVSQPEVPEPPIVQFRSLLPSVTPSHGSPLQGRSRSPRSPHSLRKSTSPTGDEGDATTRLVANTALTASLIAAKYKPVKVMPPLRSSMSTSDLEITSRQSRGPKSSALASVAARPSVAVPTLPLGTIQYQVAAASARTMSARSLTGSMKGALSTRHTTRGGL